MITTNIEVLQQLEILAAAFPWDRCALWISRTPEGKYDFTAMVDGDTEMKIQNKFGYGKTPAEAVHNLIPQRDDNDRTLAQSRLVAKLRAELEKAENSIPPMPRYIPNRELTNGETTETPSIDV